jgi:tripartite-type tricarboxylate transporter receptor subunit TctC
MAVHPSLRVTSVAELAVLAKKRAAPLNYSSPGNGSLHQLSMEWFKSATGVNFTHVPYKGSQSINAVIAGEVSLTFASVVGMLPHVKSGRVVAIAITSRERFRLLPELPTVAESGVPGFEATNWFGILAPRGTPRPVVATLSAAIAGHMKSAELKERMLNDGAEPIGSTPEEFTALIRTELARWARVIKMSGAKVD